MNEDLQRRIEELSINTNPSVVGLLFTSSPTAILLTVMPIIINSINRSVVFSKYFYVSLVGRTHVFIEFFKRIPKAFNSSASVVWVSMVVRIIAPYSYSQPYSVQTTSRHSMSNSVRSLYEKTITTLNFSLSDIIKSSYLSLSTITRKFPSNFTIYSVKYFNCSKATVSLPSNVYSPWHYINLIKS